MSKETTYKCDLCGDICKAEILEGYKIGNNGIEFVKHPKHSNKHMCHRCIKYIEDEALVLVGTEVEDKEEEKG